jgi:eukaryotic-like serine/threonine-protein kinase
MNELFPEALPSGTVIGSWKLEDCAGYGTYGAVYRAHRVEGTDGAPVALKLARYPGDERFIREAGLLSRIQHPHVPRLLDSGFWRRGRARNEHPYLVMQWVEGLRLYAWAEQQPRTPLQILRVLSQIVRALESLHARRGLHRDVKGENILVTPEGRAFLMDFGCGTWAGAAPLTDGILAPGTRPYRSPQALSFQWNHRHSATAHYEATPRDDVYALGVTAYHLCTGAYPPIPFSAEENERGPQKGLIPSGRRDFLRPELEALILRMLSERPEDRGSAAALAEAMEALTVTRRRRKEWPFLVVPLAAILVALISGNLNLEGLRAPPSALTDGGTGGVADAAVADPPVSEEKQEPEVRSLSLDIPQTPLPGQRRPPCARSQSLVRGGCWVEIKAAPPCEEGSYAWKDACYFPAPAPRRPSTSDNP